MHPFALMFIVVALTGCVAAVTPYTGRFGLLKNWALFLVEVSVLMGMLAALGKALHDFMFE
jgi:hypothetical protein